MPQGLLVIISSPSGGGKDAVIKAALKKIDHAARLVTTTTRQMREQEKNGLNYFFINREEFEKKIKADEFIEYNLYADNYYGTEKKVVQDTLNKYSVVLTNIDVNGQKSFSRLKIPHISIFIVPDDLETLYKRIKKRGGTDEKLIKKRLEIAKEELKQAKNYDYQVVNYEGKMNETVDKVVDIIKSELQGLDKKQHLR